MELPTVAVGRGFTFTPAELKALQQSSEARADRSKVARRRGKV
ncbi:hypothetical protein [Calidithermus timidus]|nr:hypothetical protein [Calidithermus timidus]